MKFTAIVVVVKVVVVKVVVVKVVVVKVVVAFLVSGATFGQEQPPGAESFKVI